MTVSKYKPPKGEELSRNQFEFQYIIGKGGFGKVWKVLEKKHKIIYALKEMKKVKVIDKRSEKSVKYERELLSRLKHPFIVNMYYSFQDYENLYLVMDYLTGGDLRYHISRHKRFSENQTKFFLACILLGLEYIHSKKIIHRDIKPENLVLDQKGFVRITDFGIAKVNSSKNYTETSGTPGYMSPEVMKGQNHSYPVDYFALGVIGYEFMLGKRPYYGRSRKEIKEQILSKQAHIKLSDIPDGWTEDSADFFNKLLIRKPDLRLGYNGIFEIKMHPWLKFFKWDLLKEKKLESPFIPERKDNFDKRYCESIDRIGIETKGRYEKYVREDGFNELFLNFTYYNIGEMDDNNDYLCNINEIKRLVTMKSKSKGNINVNFNRNNKNLSITTSFAAKQNKSIRNDKVNNITGNSSINRSKSTSQRTDRTKKTISGKRISLIQANDNFKNTSLNMNSSISSANFMQIYRKRCRSISPIDHLKINNNKSYAKNALLNTSRKDKKLSKSAIQESQSPIRNLSPNNKIPRTIGTPISKRSNLKNNIQSLSENRKKRLEKFHQNLYKNYVYSYTKKIQKNGNTTSELLMQIRKNNNMKLKKNNITNNSSKYRKNVNKFGSLISKNNSTKLSFEVELNSSTSNLSNNLKKITHNNNENKTINNNFYNINGVNVSNNNININLIFNEHNYNKKAMPNKINQNQQNVLKQSNSVNFLFKNYKMGLNNTNINSLSLSHSIKEANIVSKK